MTFMTRKLTQEHGMLTACQGVILMDTQLFCKQLHAKIALHMNKTEHAKPPNAPFFVFT